MSPQPCIQRGFIIRIRAARRKTAHKHKMALSDTSSGKNRDGENFPVGSFLIRPDLRAHVHAFYNFARAADDISDHPLLEPEVKVARLKRFAEILLGDKGNDVPSAAAMRASLQATGITPQHCLDLLQAFT